MGCVMPETDARSDREPLQVFSSDEEPLQVFSSDEETRQVSSGEMHGSPRESTSEAAIQFIQRSVNGTVVWERAPGSSATLSPSRAPAPSTSPSPPPDTGARMHWNAKKTAGRRRPVSRRISKWRYQGQEVKIQQVKERLGRDTPAVLAEVSTSPNARRTKLSQLLAETRC